MQIFIFVKIINARSRFVTRLKDFNIKFFFMFYFFFFKYLTCIIIFTMIVERVGKVYGTKIIYEIFIIFKVLKIRIKI